MRLQRRHFLEAVGVGLAATALSALSTCASEDSTLDPGTGVFRHGVASGDPLPHAVILWTRVTSEVPVEVTWEIAAEPTFRTIVGTGSSVAGPERDYTVKVDAEGLDAGTTYFYRFRAHGETSPIGRTKTAPLHATRLRFAVACCASLAHGYFWSYASIAERADLDAVIHLGDYLYEYADQEYGDERPSLPHHELVTLQDYRERYAQYRRDVDLQAVHQQHPFITTWDDHEVADNAWAHGAGNHGDDPDEAEGSYAARKKAAFQAYDEWMPIRGIPDGRIWRVLRYGDLADLIILDTRHWGKAQQAEEEAIVAAEARQLLGADQEEWFHRELVTSRARWKVVCQQGLVSPLPQYRNTDNWDGYPKARARFYDAIERANVKDVVVLSGDIHASFANELAREPWSSERYDATTGRGALAIELVTPAITAPAPSEPHPSELRGNPWMKYYDLEKNGFLLLDLAAGRAQGEFYYVKDVESRNGQVAELGAALATDSGASHLRYESSPARPPPSVAPLAQPLAHVAARRARRDLPARKPLLLRRDKFGPRVSRQTNS